MSGYIKIHRSMYDNPLFQRFPEFEGPWVWMISQARWKTNGLGRGQLQVSKRSLHKRYPFLSVSKCERFLGHLVGHKMIEIEPQTGQKLSLVTICNYEKYQLLNHAGEPVSEPQDEKTGPQSEPSSKNRKKDTNISVEADFDQWWEHYPKKVGKGHAKRAFTTALKKTSLENLIAAVRTKRGGLSAEPQFRPNPATWLNGERWADEEQPRRSDVVVPYRFGVR